MLKKGVFAMASDNRKELLNAFLTYGTLGIEMGLSLVIGLGIGYYLDRHFGTSPVFLIIFMIFGLLAGMRRLYTLWKKAEKEDERDVNKRY
jgi:ATP synthase protein I